MTITVGDQDYYVLHNGDYSGDVLISKPEKSKPGDIGSMSLPVFEGPYELMEEIVGNKLKDDEISRLEQMSGREYLSSTYVVSISSPDSSQTS